MTPSDFRISRASVTGMSDEDLCWAVVEPVWPTDEIQITDELDHIAKATRGQRAIYATMLYAREVDNGGIKQFLSNSSGLYSRCVLDGLLVLGATELHEAFQQVVGYFPGGQPPVDWEDRRRMLTAFSEERWDSIRTHEDTIYGKGGFEGNLTPRWMHYIQQHPDDFFV